jgi:hypothetical protein
MRLMKVKHSRDAIDLVLKVRQGPANGQTLCFCSAAPDGQSPRTGTVETR